MKMYIAQNKFVCALVLFFAISLTGRKEVVVETCGVCNQTVHSADMFIVLVRGGCVPNDVSDDVLCTSCGVVCILMEDQSS